MRKNVRVAASAAGLSRIDPVSLSAAPAPPRAAVAAPYSSGCPPAPAADSDTISSIHRMLFSPLPFGNWQTVSTHGAESSPEIPHVPGSACGYAEAGPRFTRGQAVRDDVAACFALVSSATGRVLPCLRNTGQCIPTIRPKACRTPMHGLRQPEQLPKHAWASAVISDVCYRIATIN